MEKLIDISSYPVANVLDLLLQDKSTKKNIIWATDTYEELGEGFTDKVQIIAGSAGTANPKKGRGVHACLALQSDEQLLR